MHKTLYIDVDEEITGVIDRIRRESATDVFLVVPKNAMLCQGLLNLKLLKREADKLGKNVLMVTNDKYAKKVIERAGLTLSNKPVPEPDEKKKVTQADRLPEKASVQAVAEIMGEQQDDERREINVQEEEIGSHSFFTETDHNEVANQQPGFDQGPQNKANPVPKSYFSKFFQKEINSSPSIEKPIPPSIVSKPAVDMLVNRVQPIPPKPPMPTAQPVMPLPAKPDRMAIPSVNQPPSVMPKTPSDRPQEPPIKRWTDMHQSEPRQNFITPQVQKPVEFRPSTESQQKVSVQNQNKRAFDPAGRLVEKENQVPVHSGLPMTGAWKSKEAEEFFTGSKNKKEEPAELSSPKMSRKEDTPQPEYIPQAEKKAPVGRRWKLIIAIFFTVLLLGIGGGIIYYKYPIVTVSVYPKQKVVDLPYNVKVIKELTAIDADQMMVPGQEKIVEVVTKIEYPTSGEKFTSDDGKAKGKVTIYNNFSSSAQPLVATTRLLSQDKKLFRLVSAVTVPGMEGNTPGKIEADVIADEPGESHNIGPSSFTIEGFKGTPKYSKFEVKSEASMSGGSNQSGNRKVKVATASDIETVRQKAMDEMDNGLEKEVQAKLPSGLAMMIDTAQKEIINDSVSHKEGAIVDAITCTITQRVTVLAYSKSDVQQLVTGKATADQETGYQLKSLSDIQYLGTNMNKDRTELVMQVSVEGMFRPTIDVENIKKGIAGKGEEDMKTFLANYDEIEKVEILFQPPWLNAVPAVERKIDVKVVE